MSNHKCSKFICKYKKRFNQRGQALALYAIAFPILFMFVCVGIDMGWYYLNVSRLQNAAEAASIAGANKLSEGAVENVEKILLIYEDDYPTQFKDTHIDISTGEIASDEYAQINLSDTGESGDLAESADTATDKIINAWTNEEVTPTNKLYQDEYEILPAKLLPTNTPK